MTRVGPLFNDVRACRTNPEPLLFLKNLKRIYFMLKKRSISPGINKNTIKIYWQQVRRYRLSFFTMLIAIPLGALLIDTLLPYFFSQAIGGLVNRDGSVITHNLLIATGIGLSGVIFNVIGFQTMVRHEAYVRTKLTMSTFSKLINKDFQFFINEKIGALTSRFIDFVRAEITLQDLLIIRTLGFVLSMGIGLILLASQSLVVAGSVLFLILAIIFQIKWSVKKRAAWRHERKILAGEINGVVADAITNNLVVKTFVGEKQEEAKLFEKSYQHQQIYIKDIGFMSVEGSGRVALMVIIQIIAISLSAYLVFHSQMTIAAAIFTLTYLQRIAAQLFTLGEMLNGYDQALLEAAPISEMLMKPIIVKDAVDAATLTVKGASIAFDKVSYHYPDSKQNVIDSLHLTIPKGQRVGLVGRSGAGKTTITHLLLRFADVTKGAIEIDGQDIATITQESLRRAVAYVPQEPMLFHRSLRENIAYGKPDATDKEILTAARQANALEFIKKLPDGLDTTVGERGVKLSGGQRQRVAIARAILKDAPILVLDEATSALDSESEALIQKALKNLMEGRTSIVIAHRLSTIAKLDRIIVMEDGSIIEDGSHEQLLAQNGKYAQLWAHQSGGFIEE